MRRVIGRFGKAGLRSFQPSNFEASASRSSVPSSTSRITPIASTSLLIEAIRTGSSMLIARLVAGSAWPKVWVAMMPSRSKATRTRATGSPGSAAWAMPASSSAGRADNRRRRMGGSR